MYSRAKRSWENKQRERVIFARLQRLRPWCSTWARTYSPAWGVLLFLLVCCSVVFIESHRHSTWCSQGSCHTTSADSAAFWRGGIQDLQDYIACCIKNLTLTFNVMQWLHDGMCYECAAEAWDVTRQRVFMYWSPCVLQIGCAEDSICVPCDQLCADKPMCSMCTTLFVSPRYHFMFVNVSCLAGPVCESVSLFGSSHAHEHVLMKAFTKLISMKSINMVE